MKVYSIEDFDYQLPEEKIAQYPLSNRDESKLLVFDKDKTISHHKFYELPELIPIGSLLLRNSSKVIPARIYFEKETGGKAEVLLLEPIEPSNDPQIALSSTNECTWKILLRGKNLKKDMKLIYPEKNKINTDFFCTIIEKNSEYSIAKFNWSNSRYTFANLLEQFGRIPLPPYISRKDNDLDKLYYQTLYGNNPGSVASHTAGLHFSNRVIENLKRKCIDFSEITLHISLGTFKPIKSKDIFEHKMHEEKFSITIENLKKIYNFLRTRKENQLFIAVGTTSVRTLESIYWLAQKLFTTKSFLKNNLHEVEQLIWKKYPQKLSPIQSLEFLLDNMERAQNKIIVGNTSLYITPGYQINFFDAIITNFHLPRSTLLLLICAFVGEEWKRIYMEALENGYRFLSYGDTSLLFKISN